MKYEWKKNEKEIYGVKEVPVLSHIPSQKFITIQGKGNPNHEDFANRVSALYAIAYGIKMNFKKKMQISGQDHEIDDYAVYPLVGVWKGGIQDNQLVKEELEYTIMIKQPDYITEEMFEDAMNKVEQKKPSPLLREICFEVYPQVTCVQVLHVGAFDDEPASFAKLNAFISQNGLKRVDNTHQEVYLNNANRVSQDKLKTILRYLIN